MHKLTTKGCLLLILTFLFISSNAQEPDMNAVKITEHWEFAINGVVEPFHNIMFLIYSNNYMILKEPYGFEASNSNGKIAPAGYRYFVVKKGERYGIAFRSLAAQSGVKYAVDSLINNYLESPSTLYNHRTKGPDSVKIITNKASGLTLEKITNQKTTDLDQDSCYFYYQDKKIDLPFKNKSERLKDLFLYKCRVIFNAHKKGEKLSPHFKVPRREWLFEIEDCEVPEKKELIMLLERFNLLHDQDIRIR